MRARAAGIAVGFVVDRVLGEPPAAVHPVALFGSGSGWLERHLHRPRRLPGVVHAATCVGSAWALGRALERSLGPGPATAAAVAVSVAGRMLAAEATAVIDAVERGDLDAARARLPALVGRDTTTLDGPEVLRAVVESVAENAVDAVVAPLAWAAIGGAPAVLAHRAANTLDAVVGHRDERYERFGWASARLDDALAWVPARLAAAGVALLCPRRAAAVWRAVRHDAPAHPSPNAGVIEAAVAAALGVRLGGTNRYAGVDEARATLGAGERPDVAQARRAVALVRRLGALAAVVAAAVARPGPRSGPAVPLPLSSPLRVSGPVPGTAVSN